MTTHGLGRRVNHDPRSRGFLAPRATHHRPVLHRTYGPVLDQGNLGSCVGNAAAHALNTAGSHRVPSKLLREPDAVEIYAAATRVDPWPGEFPGEDTGTDANSAAKVLRDRGLIAGWEHAFGLDHLLLALQLRPVLLGITWHRSMFKPDEKGFVHPDGNVVGGHETLIRGDDPAGQFVTIRNSWGSGWGVRGHYRLTYADLDQLLRDEGDALTLTLAER
jgi:hypothetical protein